MELMKKLQTNSYMEEDHTNANEKYARSESKWRRVQKQCKESIWNNKLYCLKNIYLWSYKYNIIIKIV